jgi:3-oxoacyl-[acyl-carrier-protein] synthase-3
VIIWIDFEGENMTGEFHNIKIQGMASAVPEYTEDNMSYTSVLGERRTKKQIRLTGVSKRHISSKYQRTSDLCYTAATALLDKLRWDKKDIKVFIMVTQSANYNIPSTSFFLQKRLGLGKDCIVFDVNLGCSSFNAGVHIASSLLQSCNVSDKAQRISWMQMFVQTVFFLARQVLL